MKTPKENQKDLIFAWLNKQIKANKLNNETLFNRAVVRSNYDDHKIMIFKGVRFIADILDISWIERDWDGNEQTGENWRERLFEYRGYTFYQLASAEEFKLEDKKNEKTALAD